jgi:hypothetical protein
VGFADGPLSFRPDKNEVEKVVEIPVDFFLNEKNVHLQTEIKIFNGSLVHVPAYIFEDHIIWGATAIMLSEFTFLMEKVRSTPL